MPRKRKTKKTAKAKKGAKRHNKNSYSTSMSSLSPSKLILRGNVGAVVPDEYFCTLKYTTVIQHFSAGGLTNQIFYANSLYDPDYSHALNHQPMGFDQLAFFYNKYQVLGCKLIIEVTNNSSTVPVSCTYGFTAQNPVFLNDLYFPETQYIKVMPVGTAAGNGIKKAVIQCATKKILGQKSILADERTWGNCGSVTGSSPTDFVFAFCQVNADDQVSTVNCYVRYTLHFHSRFFQRINLPPSYGFGGPTGHTGATGTTLIV